MIEKILAMAVLSDVSALKNGSALLLTMDCREPIFIHNAAALPIVLAGNFDLSISETVEVSRELLARIQLKLEV